MNSLPIPRAFKSTPKPSFLATLAWETMDRVWPARCDGRIEACGAFGPGSIPGVGMSSFDWTNREWVLRGNTQ